MRAVHRLHLQAPRAGQVAQGLALSGVGFDQQQALVQQLGQVAPGIQRIGHHRHDIQAHGEGEGRALAGLALAGGRDAAAHHFGQAAADG